MRSESKEPYYEWLHVIIQHHHKHQRSDRQRKKYKKIRPRPSLNQQQNALTHAQTVKHLQRPHFNPFQRLLLHCQRLDYRLTLPADFISQLL